MTNAFRLYSRELLPLYLFVCTLFVMGVVFGALLVNALTLQQKQELSQYLHTFFQTYSGPDSPDGLASHSISEIFASHARWVFFIWVLGLSVVGVPIILILDFLKGVLVGFTAGYLAGQWSWKGMMFAFVSVAPQNILAVPAIIICSVTAISFSMLLVRSRLFQHSGTVGQPFAAFTLTALALSAVLFGASAFEAYVSPGLLKWATPILLDGV